ncbi:hypothetical protein HRR83_001994 [Exophiala dermatitidis]|uniref:Uncharacterized protein n=2 Tax=Exophiala dermatitidis TaxID=5970 RepID=H6BZ63_EXODN|nr:uncharacterized protein HMPREF1120_04990 [Exophiala dermatitidis NIH/UT8656]KAJ4514357.1 hypothetical protein HRR73_005383 [Exophiala dermatitidis]EHY56926.1 hypothetical protein HMPREF1120_04990 [Exophiala dermatitidis NIH/UT8656]KAJ4523876.1 hypothetical protein HRR74_002071 [Exophiala dermatitidis]KAJ4537184.1 hypothetical protein HRR76_005197 [Exophiala dermatitidis]KAJ4555218.1 hypothetical protein HRR77_001158 [Exophiala dermatitidis]
MVICREMLSVAAVAPLPPSKDNVKNVDIKDLGLSDAQSPDDMASPPNRIGTTGKFPIRRTGHGERLSRPHCGRKSKSKQGVRTNDACVDAYNVLWASPRPALDLCGKCPFERIKCPGFVNDAGGRLATV